MEPLEFVIDDRSWRCTRLSAHEEFKVERHTKGVGWDTVMECAVVDEDGNLIHDNSLNEEVVQCCEDAIEAYLEHEGSIYGFVPDHDPRSKCADALELLLRYGGIDGGHHKQWCIDQVVRILTDENYENFVAWACDGEDGPDTYDWDEGTAP